MTWFLYLALLLVLAHAPVIPSIRVMSFDIPNKSKLIACMLTAFFKNLLTILPDLLAPIIVPVALLFTKWEDDRLPRLFCWWDNDASINGDVRRDDSWALAYVPVESTPSAIAMCYWAKGHHPRSFYARWVWLGLRNRASRLSQMLGVNTSGLSVTEYKGSTWTVTRVGDYWRYYELLPIGSVCLRMHCGYKVPMLEGEDKAPVVSIGFSFKRIN